MGELYKTQHTIDEMLDRMGVKIVLDSEHLSEEDRFEAEKQGASVVLKKYPIKKKRKSNWLTCFSGHKKRRSGMDLLFLLALNDQSHPEWPG